MGCSVSKEEDLPLVVRCRERRELIRAAANHRYALAAAHVSYFRSLKQVGDALRKFVDEELITASSSSSSFSSPSLTLPPSSKKNRGNGDESPLHLHDGDSDDESHLHLSDSSSEEDDSEDHHHHHHHSHGHGGLDGDDAHQHHGGNRFEEKARNLYNEDESFSHLPHDGFSGYANGFASDPFANPFPNPYPYPMMPQPDPYTDRWEPQGMPPAAQPWFYTGNSNVYYMKKSAPASKTVVQGPPAEPAYGYSDSYWNSPPGYGGNYGYYPMGSPAGMVDREAEKRKPEREAPPPPSPKASAWDFFDPFNAVDSGYAGYYSGVGYGYGSNYSSPDSTEVREREGIPDLEEETETETYKEFLDGGKKKGERKMKSAAGNPHSRAIPARRKNEDSSRSVPMHRSEGSSRSGPSSKSKGSSTSASLHKIDSSSTSLPSWSSEESEKPSMPPQNNGKSSMPSMASHYGEEHVKPSMSTTPQGEGTSWVDETGGSISLTDDKSSSDNVVVKSVDEGSGKKKGVTFEVETSRQDGDSSMLSSVALSSPRGTRDLREVVAEIRDEFEIASSYGKEVAMMLEVGKLPYQPSLLKGSVIFSILAQNLILSYNPSFRSSKG